jgi:ketosteroid isomerase-like protein
LRRTLILLVCAAALAAIAGCGESDQEQAREIVQDYVDARNDGDFERVCELFSDDFKAQLQIGEDCAAFIKEQSGGGEADSKLEVVDVRVKDERATADINVVREGEGPSRVTLTLERQDGNWKITGLQ